MKDYSDISFNWCSEILAQVGYGIQARRILKPLLEGGANIKLIPNEPYISPDRKITDSYWLDQLKKSESIKDHKIQINFCIPEMYQLKQGIVNIGYTMWETDSYPKGWIGMINQCDRFLVGSPPLVNSALKAGIRVPVDVLESSLDFSLWSPEGDSLDINGIKEDAVKFLFVGNWIPRKNYEDLLAAFSVAFNTVKGSGIDYTDTTLIIKTWGQNNTPEAKLHIENGVRHILSKLAGINRPSVNVITDLIPESQIAKLMRGVDVYVSASHGEGFDLPMTQAMACGVLPLANNFLGHYYLNSDNALIYDHSLTPVVGAAAPHYDADQMWARPNMDSFIGKLRKARELVLEHRKNPKGSLYSKLTAEAMKTVKDRFDPVVIADHLAAYIRSVRDGLPSSSEFKPDLVLPSL